jgi:YfiH family protein
VDAPPLIRWERPGVVVAFTTREGGVSEGPYASLNLGARGDDPARVDENRRRVCAALGVDATRLALNRQRHTPTVHRARPGARGEAGDGLWTDESGLPMLALAADCVPIAIARDAGRPALAVMHAGWRGLAEGVVESGVAALGDGAKSAAVGPSVGPCCYEVGPEVARLFDRALVRGRILDLWAAAERALRRAGVDDVDRVDLCTRCRGDLFFSHRRDGAVRGTHGVVGAVAG